MSQSAVRVIKSVDMVAQNRGTLPPTDEREFWLNMRHLLLQQLALIEKRLGISRRCRNCGDDISSR